MNTRPQLRTLLVALLCLWLPLQAAAGSWLPCHWLDQASQPATELKGQSGHQGCGGDAEPANTSNPVDDPVDLADMNTPCYHCQASCHFGTAVLLPTTLPPLLLAPINHSPSPTPALASIALDNPQRPPRHA